jgi:ribosomal protein L40E
MNTVVRLITEEPMFDVVLLICVIAIANIFYTLYRARKLGAAICTKCGNQGPLTAAGIIGQNIVCKKCGSTDWKLVKG